MARKSAVKLAESGVAPEQVAAFAADIVKKWPGRVVLGSDISRFDSNRKPISTGSTKLDWALTKSLVEGTINEIHGKNGTGKTTLGLEVAANATLMDKPVFFFDLERKLVDAQISMIPRLNRDLFFRIRPDNGEDAVNKVHRCVTEMPGCVVIFDSLTQMLPEVEDAERAEKQTMGAIARLAAKMVRKIVGPTERNRCMVLFISHETANMDPYAGGITTKGGRAVPDISAQRIHLKALSAGKIKDEKGNQIGQNIKCKVMKNNQGLPFREVEVPIIYGRGIDRALDLLQVAVDLGVIEKTGGWYTYEHKGESKKMYKIPLLNIIKTDKPYRDYIVNAIYEIL